MLVLFDTPAGHALFKVKKPDKLKSGGDLFQYFADPDAAAKMYTAPACGSTRRVLPAARAPRARLRVAGVLTRRRRRRRRRVSLKAFSKFEDTAEALQSATALVEGKLSAGMKKFLKKNVVSSEVQVAAARARRRRCRPPPPARRPPAATPPPARPGRVDLHRAPHPAHCPPHIRVHGLPPA